MSSLSIHLDQRYTQCLHFQELISPQKVVYFPTILPHLQFKIAKVLGETPVWAYAEKVYEDVEVEEGTMEIWEFFIHFVGVFGIEEFGYKELEVGLQEQMRTKLIDELFFTLLKWVCGNKIRRDSKGAWIKLFKRTFDGSEEGRMADIAEIVLQKDFNTKDFYIVLSAKDKLE
jgi:hypothetical protein